MNAPQHLDKIVERVPAYKLRQELRGPEWAINEEYEQLRNMNIKRVYSNPLDNVMQLSDTMGT
jgi:uncharacterized protein YecE (DUF72 family)